MGTHSGDLEWTGCVGIDLHLDEKFSWIGS
jgi:hypothetical protein